MVVAMVAWHAEADIMRTHSMTPFLDVALIGSVEEVIA
jgi:hypothetical protein